jgi:hypothetical protein
MWIIYITFFNNLTFGPNNRMEHNRHKREPPQVLVLNLTVRANIVHNTT